MERVQAAQRPAQGDEVQSLAEFPASDALAVPSLEKFELLTLTARSAPGQERRDATAALHAALATFPRAPEYATLLLRLLDEGAFNDLRNDDGTTTREVAVEALLNLGYPWALQIQPEELSRYRQLALARTRNKWLLLLGILGLGALAATFLMRLF